MDNYYKNSIEEIKSDLNKLEQKNGVKIIFAAVAAVALVTLVVVYLVLKFKSSVAGDYYEEYSEDDGAEFPFDEEDEAEDEEEAEEEA